MAHHLFSSGDSHPLTTETTKTKEKHMSLIVSEQTDDTPRTLVPEGPSIARCYSLIDLGTHDDEWQGKVRKRRKVVVGFEFPEHTAVFKEEDGEQPLGRSQVFTANLGAKANLRKTLESWRGKAFDAKELEGFDLQGILGAPALVTVTHVEKDGKKKDRIQSIGAVPKGLECPEAVNEPFAYDIAEHPKNFDRLPNWAKEEVLSSDEYLALAHPDGVPSADGADPLTEETDNTPF